MKQFAGRTAVALAVATSLALASPLIAAAKSPPVPAVVQAYHAALRTYNHAKMKIDQAFHQAMVQARLVELDALNSSESPAEGLLARAQFNVTRATAITTWDSALKKLGTPPKASWRKKPPEATPTELKDSIAEG